MPHGSPFQKISDGNTGQNQLTRQVKLLAPLGRNWSQQLVSLIRSTRKNLLISSPFITSAGCDLLNGNLPDIDKSTGIVSFLTDLSPASICQGSVDPAALCEFCTTWRQAHIWHLPRLHAKVYVADQHTAIVTSGNLTAGGIFQNFEYGACITDSSVVRTIRNDITAYSSLGALISLKQLERFCELASEVRKSFLASQASVARSIRRRFEAVVRETEDELIRFRLAGGAVHTVFARTILYLLRTVGPQSTVQIHHDVQRIHPDLCDDREDRIIDGRHFGKKWKHAVRTAQQQLKKQGVVELQNGLWRTAQE